MPRYRTMQDAVAQFQKAFGRPTDLNFSDMEMSSDVAKTFGLRQALIEEEFYELIKAMNEKNEHNIKKESADLLYVLDGLFVDFLTRSFQPVFSEISAWLNSSAFL